MAANRLDEFVDLLSRLPSRVWTKTVTQAVGWRLMKPFSEDWEFGPFATLFVVIGLNNYQTKRKADVGYWPEVVAAVPRKTAPRTSLELAHLLTPFYSKERFGEAKVRRLNRFCQSDLCDEIWESDARSVASEFTRIWRSLAQTMGQSMKRKTIVYAMKCLARALLMADEVDFDYSEIPCRFTRPRSFCSAWTS